MERGDADGIGFALGPPYVGVDLDEELPEPDKGAVMLALGYQMFMGWVAMQEPIETAPAAAADPAG